MVSSQGAKPVTSYVEAVERRPPPTTSKELQVFLGLVNFYRRFLLRVAVTLRLLTDALRGNRPANERLTWTAEMESSFWEAKASLRWATWLGHLSPMAHLALHVDALSSHIGAALHQQLKDHSTWQPLGFFSKKLEVGQAKKSAFDRELIACVEGIRHFRFILEGQPFTIYMDRKPLSGALARVSDPWTARQCHHLAYVAKFTADIQHIAGQENVGADALSSPPASPATVAPVALGMVADLYGIAFHQSSFSSMLQASKSPSLQVRTCEVEGVSVLCDVSTGRLRSLVPEADRPLVFKTIHGVPRPGIRAMRRMISAHFLWPGMRADMASGCRDCVACQGAKVTKQPQAPVQAIPIPSQRFSHVHVDLVGPFAASEDGFLYLMTMMDHTTRWLEAVFSVSTSTCIDVFFSTWVARFGVPETVTSDRGTQFTSAS